MRNLIISNYDDLLNPYYAGGGAQAIHQIAKRLSGYFKVRVITGSYPHAVNQVIDRVEYIRIGLSWTGGRVSQLIFQSLLPLYAMTESYDLWVESFTPPFSTAFLPHFTAKPVVGLVHMLAAKDMERKYKIPFSYIERFGIKQYKHLIVLTEQMKIGLRLLNPKADIKVIPNGVEKMVYPVSDSKKYILYLGRLEFDQKGLDLLLEAFNLVKAIVANKLVIAGSGSKQDTDKIVNKIRDLDLSDKVELIGRISGKEKQVILQQALAVVVPSRFETFSLVALEALANSIPLICFDIDGLKWLPDNCVVKVAPYDYSAFGAAIISVLQNPDTGAINRGLRYSHRYDWDGISLDYMDYLYKVGDGANLAI